MGRSLLLVDDEPMVLSGLRRGLHSMRGEWQMEFAGSGEEALQAMAKQTFDVIVTDMRMPGMNGAQLLNEVRQRFPQTIRMVLSGQCDRETILRGVGSTHQYVSKPCDTQQLKDTIQQALALRSRLETTNLTKVVSRLKTIPSLPSLFQAMMEELGRSEPRLDQLAALVSRDMGMAAKCLQLVNSALFGLRSPVSDPLQALSLLGLDTLKSLILSSHIFSSFKSGLFDAKQVSWLWEHSFAVSICARKIAEMQGVSPKQIQDSVTAGLLHDTGKLVLASCMASEYKMALDLAASTKISLTEAEHEVLGCGHAEVGAYLLGFWGLPDPVVEAVAFHQNPLANCATGSAAQTFSALTAVHSACAYDTLHYPSPLSNLTLDMEYLTGLSLNGRIPAWFAACDKAMHENGSR